jgi:hypothetical protein
LRILGQPCEFYLSGLALLRAGCGPDRNVSRFAELVDEAAAKAVADGAAAAARPITIEDCNDAPAWDRGLDPDNQSVSYPSGGCAVSGGGFYRIGGDIKADWATVVMAVQGPFPPPCVRLSPITVDFMAGPVFTACLAWTGMAQHLQHCEWHTPQTRPGCWGTPDALEVGCTRQGALGMDFIEARSHFGYWVITSCVAPRLPLGFAHMSFPGT